MLRTNTPEWRHITATPPVGGGVTFARSRLAGYPTANIYFKYHSELDSESINLIISLSYTRSDMRAEAGGQNGSFCPQRRFTRAGQDRGIKGEVSNPKKGGNL